MLPEANRVKRESVPVSEIILALECGGSDSYSGISANPALGYAVDRLVRQGEPQYCQRPLKFTALNIS